MALENHRARLRWITITFILVLGARLKIDVLRTDSSREAPI